MSDYSGIPFEPHDLLTDPDRAVKVGGVIRVSRATYDALKAASPEELEALLRKIKLIDLDNGAQPSQPWYHGPRIWGLPVLNV